MRLRLRHLLLLFIGLPAFAQKPLDELHLTSSKQQKIAVYKGTIIVNGNKTFKFASDNIVYKSKRNRLVEDGGNVFLFLEVTDNPGKNKLIVFGINNSVADSLMTAIASDIKDFDHDELLEFGGSEQTEAYPAADSMYYVPAKFYEFKKGRIVFDAAYTEKIDKKVNGVYIPDAQGKKVIPKPKGRP
ncbi:hypothetical protein [Chitinophaga sp. CF418]|uniref:hypothetical protein n=1 Tax=Chitinophaga sp. CF418 TaxID=1855287 RepID=UPI0009137917|nr:hypothetical protein [Chitinophaga sp. CF418]SHN10409.1 hypothetical protein SAMN05216311_105171 [Chitinophaga sp. CF418]